MYNVSSAYQAAAADPLAAWSRQLLIGTSDYASRVTAWPTVSRTWNNINPSTVIINLSNDDGALNMLMTNPALLNSPCQLNIGFSSIVTLVGSGVAQCGAAKSLTLAAGAVTSVDAYINKTIRLVSGTGSGQQQNILSSRKNLIAQSQNFEVSSAFNTFNTSIIPNASVSPDGTNTMAFVFANVSSAYHYIYQSYLFAQGVQYTHSIYVKAGPVGGYHHTLWSANPINCSIETDLVAGTIIGSSGTNYVSSAIAQVGSSGIFRISMTFNAQVYSWGGTCAVVNAMSSPSSGSVFAGTGSAGFYIWGDQLEVGSMASEYIRTLASAAVGVAVNSPWVTQPDSTTNYTLLTNGEYLTTFAGTIQSVQYNNGVSRGGAGEGSTAAGNGSAIAELTLIDKFINLATRVCGDATTPINYTGSNYTPMDMAWYICTSYGGLSAITSTSNPDIDYASFGSWSSVFSADSTKMQASFSGQKPVELLQKISNLTQSAIGIENNKVKFARFNLTSSATSVFDESSVIDTLVTLDMTGLINKMSVGALYNVSSQSYGITVTAIDTPSVNSYGIHQDNSMETNIWLVDSVSANNLVQRTLFSGKAILPSFQMTTPLQAIASTIGDILLYSDAQLSISSQAYRCMAEDLDLDGGTKTYYMNQTMLANVFRLDYSSLDSSDVLT